MATGSYISTTAPFTSLHHRTGLGGLPDDRLRRTTDLPLSHTSHAYHYTGFISSRIVYGGVASEICHCSFPGFSWPGFGLTSAGR